MGTIEELLGGTGLDGPLKAATMGVAIIMVIYNVAICLFGYRLFRIQLMITGFLICGVLGALLGMFGGSVVAIIVALGFGVLGAWLVHKLYKVGVFLTVFGVTTLLLAALIGLISGGFSSGVMVASVILGIMMGILGVILDKLIIILFTAISGGLFIGVGLVLLGASPVVGVLIGILLAIFGIWLQFRLEKKNPKQNSVPQAGKPVTDRLNFNVGEAAKSFIESTKDAADIIVLKVTRKESSNSDQTVLVSSAQDRWTNGMPMLVTETQIITRTEDSDHVYLNIGMQNLAKQPIVGFYFDITCYDLLKNEVESLSNISFLDLNLEPGKSWFSAQPIRLPDKTTRKCMITVRNVVLKNEEIWKNDANDPLRELPKAEALMLAPDLREEYDTEIEQHLQVHNAKGLYRFSPKEEDGYWHCSCGQVNTSEICVLCGLEKDFLFAIFDPAKLQTQMEHRIAEKRHLEEERRQRIVEQTEAVKQKSAELAGKAKQTYIKFAGKAKALGLSVLDKLKQHKKKVILIGSASFGVLAVLIIGLSIYNSDFNRFSRALKREEYVAAALIYDDASDKAQEKMNSDLFERAALIEAQFIEEKTDWKTAVANLNILMGATDASLPQLSQTQMRMEALHQSRIAFQQGRDELSAKNYQSAADCFAGVIAEDKNYAQAQTEIQNAKDAYKAALLKDAEALLAQENFDEATALLMAGREFLGDSEELNAVQQKVEMKIGDKLKQIEEQRRLEEERLAKEERNRPYQAMKDMVQNLTANSAFSLSQLPDESGVIDGNFNLIDVRLLPLEQKGAYELFLAFWGLGDGAEFDNLYTTYCTWADGKLSPVTHSRFYTTATETTPVVTVTRDKDGNDIVCDYIGPTFDWDQQAWRDDYRYRYSPYYGNDSDFYYNAGEYSIDGVVVSKEDFDKRREIYTSLTWRVIADSGNEIEINAQEPVDHVLAKLDQLMQ